MTFTTLRRSLTPPTPADVAQAIRDEIAGLAAELAKAIREDHARHYAKERARDARVLAAYQAECLASWAKRDVVAK